MLTNGKISYYYKDMENNEAKGLYAMTMHFPQWTYSGAVEKLFELANSDTGGSRGAALVLLSVYNPQVWRIDYGALLPLDSSYFSAAMAVLDGRAFGGEEPHNVIANGRERFRSLWLDWEHLPECTRKSDA